jgi:hypothetical protein
MPSSVTTSQLGLLPTVPEFHHPRVSAHHPDTEHTALVLILASYPSFAYDKIITECIKANEAYPDACGNYAILLKKESLRDQGSGEELSEKMLSQVRKAILMVLAVILMFAAIPSVFTIPSELFLFRPEPYQQAMRSQQFYQSFPGWMAELVVEGDMQGMEEMPAALQNLQYEEYERMLRAILPPQWVAVEIEAVIDKYWAFMNFETNELELMIDLQEPKSRLTGPGSDVVVQTIMNTWPECTPNELQGILQDMEVVLPAACHYAVRRSNTVRLLLKRCAVGC